MHDKSGLSLNLVGSIEVGKVQPKNAEAHFEVPSPNTTSAGGEKKTQSSDYSVALFLCGENEVSRLVFEDCTWVGHDWSFHGVFHDQNWFLYDKVTVLESEKRAWENSPEAQAIRDALNPWKNHEAEASKES